MKNQHSRIGLMASLLIHGALLGSAFVLLDHHKVEKTVEQGALSMEMVAALLEQPAVAVAPETVAEKEIIEETDTVEEVAPEPEIKQEVDAIPDPSLTPIEKRKEEKRKEHPHKHHHHKHKKEKPKELQEKPKEKRKEHHKKHDQKPIKALERGPEAKQGIVAKAIPGATEGQKVVAGVVGGQKNGSANSTSTGSSSTAGGNPNELEAYTNMLQRALQRRANSAYPQREKMMRKTGLVTIRFKLSPSGKLTDVSVQKSSGNSNLDVAAVRSAEGLQVSPPPAGYPSQLNVPIRFLIQ